MGDFPNQVQVAQAPATVGDYCDKNPRYSYDAGPGGLIAGNIALVGHFAWVNAPFDGDGTPSVVTSYGNGPVSGFIHREQQALIVNYLAASGMQVQPGFGITVMTGGGFWALNSGANQAIPGMKAYANFADGLVTFAATGAPTAGGTSTASTLAAGTSSVTAGINDAIMTVSVVGSGVLYNGTTLAGTGVVTGTQIVSQVLPLIAGEALRGVGRYNVSISGQNVAAGSTITGTYGLLTIGGTVAGTFAIGQGVTGSSVTANMSITDVGTGLGGAGTYATNISQVLSSQAINTALNVETRWVCRSNGLPGQIVKMSDKAIG